MTAIDSTSGRVATAAATARDDERGSAAVEYVGLALVVSMLMTAVGAAVDSALGDRLAHAIVEQLVRAVSRNG